MLGALTKENWTTVVLLTARHQGLHFPERIDVSRRSHRWEVPFGVTDHVKETGTASRASIRNERDRLVLSIVPAAVRRVANVTQREEPARRIRHQREEGSIHHGHRRAL